MLQKAGHSAASQTEEELCNVVNMLFVRKKKQHKNKLYRARLGRDRWCTKELSAVQLQRLASVDFSIPGKCNRWCLHLPDVFLYGLYYFTAVSEHEIGIRSKLLDGTHYPRS